MGIEADGRWWGWMEGTNANHACLTISRKRKVSGASDGFLSLKTVDEERAGSEALKLVAVCVLPAQPSHPAPRWRGEGDMSHTGTHGLPCHYIPHACLIVAYHHSPLFTHTLLQFLSYSFHAYYCTYFCFSPSFSHVIINIVIVHTYMPLLPHILCFHPSLVIYYIHIIGYIVLTYVWLFFIAFFSSILWWHTRVFPAFTAHYSLFLLSLTGASFSSERACEGERRGEMRERRHVHFFLPGFSLTHRPSFLPPSFFSFSCFCLFQVLPAPYTLHTSHPHVVFCLIIDIIVSSHTLHTLVFVSLHISRYASLSAMRAPRERERERWDREESRWAWFSPCRHVERRFQQAAARVECACRAHIFLPEII